MKRKFRFIMVGATLLTLPGSATFSIAQTINNTSVAKEAEMYAKAEHLLDGRSIQYSYQNGWGIKFEFSNGHLKYQWTAGPRKGHTEVDLPYQSRKIGEDTYIVNWHEPTKPDFVTLVLNFKDNAVYSSVITAYGTEKEAIHFDSGTILH